MKSLKLILVIIIFFATNTKGQIEDPFTTGNLIIGGSVNANGMKTVVTGPGLVDEIRYSEKELKSNLSFGIFVSNSIVAGFKADISLFKYESETGATSYTSDFLLKPYMRYYTPIGLFVEGSYGLGYFKIGESSSTDTNERKVTS